VVLVEEEAELALLNEGAAAYEYEVLRADADDGKDEKGVERRGSVTSCRVSSLSSWMVGKVRPSPGAVPGSIQENQ